MIELGKFCFIKTTLILNSIYRNFSKSVAVTMCEVSEPNLETSSGKYVKKKCIFSAIQFLTPMNKLSDKQLFEGKKITFFGLDQNCVYLDTPTVQ